MDEAEIQKGLEELDRLSRDEYGQPLAEMMRLDIPYTVSSAVLRRHHRRRRISWHWPERRRNSLQRTESLGARRQILADPQSDQR